MRYWANIACGAVVWTFCTPLLALDPEGSLSELSHRRWTVADGLPGEIGALAQTRDGYLWIGAAHSLFHFDGIRFKQYSAPDGTTLPTVSSLFATADGALWVGLRSGGVHRIDGWADRRYDATDGVPDGVVYGFAVDPGGTLWAAVEEGLVRFHDDRWHPVSTAEGFTGQHARAIFVDAGGAVWAASEDQVFRRGVGATRFEAVETSVGWVSQIAQDPNGTIWIAHRYNGGLRAVGQPERTMTVDSTGIAFDRHGSLWVGTLGNGLIRVSIPGGDGGLPEPQTFSSRDGLSADYVRRVLEDREGNLWVGTSHGLDQFRETPFVTANLPGGAHYFALAPSPDGSLWAGSINQPVLRLTRGKVEQLAMPPPVTAATTDKSGDIWMGGPNGIWRSSDSNLVQVAELPPGGRSEGAVRALVRDHQGTLWVSVNDLGLFEWRGDGWLPVPPVSVDPNQIMPVTATIAQTGTLWFGYRNGLLVSRDVETGEIRMWRRDQGVDVGHVTAVHAGTRIWIGGQHGVAYLDGDRFRTLETSGARLEGVYGISAANGDLWVYALSGVHRVDDTELDHAARNVGYQANYTRFDDVPALGDDPTQVRPLPALVSARDGRLWFATGSGLVWVDPDRIDTPLPAPQVILEEVFADGELLPPNRPMVVPALTERLTIQYTAPALEYPERVRFRFMLEGYDNAWQEAVDRREAAYTRLPPGDYRFRVVAANQGGSWSEPGASTDIIVRAAFYQTLAFRVLLAAAILGLLWCAYRMRLRQVGHRLQLRLQERHRERERIARDLHDTLLQSVQGVLLKFHAATERLTSSDPARAALLGTLDRAEQVLEEGRRLVQGLRTVDESPDDLAHALMDAGRELASGDSPRLRAAIAGDARPLDPMVHEELLHIGREALINAFRHARAAHIEVEIGYGRRTFHLRVRDDGIGIDTAHTTENGRAGHFGIPGMYERAARVGATLKVWSRAGSGTEIDLQIPGSIAYRRRKP